MRRKTDIGRQDGGFTLVELLAVVALLALVMGVAVRGVRSVAKSDLRASASRMAGAIRYLFDRASTTGRVHRLVIDFEAGKYWAEVSDDRFYLPRERETDAWRQQQEEERAAEQEEEERTRAEGEAAGSEPLVDPTRYIPEEFRPKRTRFTSFKETTVRPVQVKGAVIAGLYTPRLAEPMAAGHGYLYFFPLGLTEAALVHLSDEEQKTFYTLVVHPLTGRVRVVNEYVEPPVAEAYDDQGNRIVR